VSTIILLPEDTFGTRQDTSRPSPKQPPSDVPP
jgi:hypothetical protein